MSSPLDATGIAGTADHGGEKDASKDAAEQVRLNFEERAPLSVTGLCFDRHVVKSPPTFAAKAPLHFDGDTVVTSPLRELAAKMVLASNVPDLRNSMVLPPSDKTVETEASPLPFDVSGLHFERDTMTQSNHESDGAASNMTFKPPQEFHLETLFETGEFLSA